MWLLEPPELWSRWSEPSSWGSSPQRAGGGLLGGAGIMVRQPSSWWVCAPMVVRASASGASQSRREVRKHQGCSTQASSPVPARSRSALVGYQQRLMRCQCTTRSYFGNMLALLILLAVTAGGLIRFL